MDGHFGIYFDSDGVGGGGGLNHGCKLMISILNTSATRTPPPGFSLCSVVTFFSSPGMNSNNDQTSAFLLAGRIMRQAKLIFFDR